MKLSIKAFLIWRKWEWQDAPSFIIDHTDMSKVSPEYAVVKEIEVEVEIPDNFDPAPQQIAALRAKKQEVLAEAHVKAENLEEQIQRLLSIEYKPAVPA